MSDQFRHVVIVSEMFLENAYLVYNEGSDECLIIDPGLDPEQIIAEIEQRGLRPLAILNTHGHADHIAGNAAMKQRWPEAPLVIGRGDADKLVDPVGNLSAAFGFSIVSPPADQLVDEGDVFEAAGMRLEVLDTPGHCSGHIVFVWKGGDPWVVIGGDVLFREGVGRMDFPDGDGPTLFRSIRDKLFPLPDSTVVLPGHGEPTTIGHEKRFNPFLQSPD